MPREKLPAVDPFRMRIQRRRLAAGWSIRELGRRAELDYETVRQIEVGDKSPNLDSLKRLALALGTTVSALVKS